MRHRTRFVSRAAAVLALASVAPSARAELVEVDLFSPGDSLVTRDTATGLDWLDLGGVTTGLSYDAIQGGAGGWLASGWRYATQAEVCALFVAHAQSVACNFSSGLVPEPTAAENLTTLLGSTGSTFSPMQISVFMTGFYDDATGGPAGEAKIEVFATFPPSAFFRLETRATPDAIPTSTSSTARASFLVRATPPEIPALPPAGVAVLAALLGIAARWRASHRAERNGARAPGTRAPRAHPFYGS